MGVDVQCQVTHKLQTCSTGPLPLPPPPSLVENQQLHSTSLFPAMQFLPFFCVWEEMTSQHTKSYHKYTGNRWAPNVFQMGFDSELHAVQPLLQQKNLWGKNNQAIKQLFWKGHCEICLLDAKRLRETLHVKVGPLFFSQTLLWVVSSCWQHMLALQLEYIYCFTQRVSPCHLNAYFYYLRVLTKFLFDCCF